MDKSLPERWPLNYWNSQEWFDVNRKLDSLEEDAIPYNPRRVDILLPLLLLSVADVRVAFFAGEPYYNPEHATGLALESDADGSIPGSLHTIFREYRRDLGIDNYPSCGSLRRWVGRGVLLWNVTPTIEIDRDANGNWKGYTHRFWREWPPLTTEIITSLSNRGERVFVFFGKRAQQYARYVNVDNGVNSVLCLPNPSPVVQAFTNDTIVGSRLFSRINAELTRMGKHPIDWTLD